MRDSEVRILLRTATQTCPEGGVIRDYQVTCWKRYIVKPTIGEDPHTWGGRFPVLGYGAPARPSNVDGKMGSK